MTLTTEPESSDATIVAGDLTERSFASGRYVVRRALAEGAQKAVYVVHDAGLDRECALALIKTDSLDGVDLERMRQEARALARLDHPNIVAVFDIGDDAGRPYFVCQYITGGDLRRALRTAGGPLPIERAIGIAEGVCRALTYAHEHGIIHRDVKPANIWLTADGTAKLGDFGLAFSAGQTRLTQDGTFVGTASYIAPEQALGGAADARSDLYALGCVLYEMVAGRVPFVGDDIVSVISQHIETAPVAPSWHNAIVPRALEALILRLLAKSPEDRPQSAEALLAALDSLATEQAPPVAEPPAGNPLDRLAAGVFVGREREVGELRRGLDDSISGRGRLLLLVGEPGIGKTRTASELCTYARLRGAQVLTGRCFEGEGAPAYWPWVQALRSYVGECDADELQSDMGPGAADIAQMVSEVHQRIPGLLPPPQLDPDQARFRLFESVAAFLTNASRRRPLVLLLDDLHWADKGSLLMLQFLARDLGRARLLVLGTYRDVELGRQHPLAQTLAELAREQNGTRVLLRGLGEVDVARYIEMTSGIVPAEALVAAVYRETEGNPFFLSEVVRLLVADGRLQATEDSTSWTVTIPQSVREVVGRRLNHVSQECNRVLTTAAVVGREFGLDALEGLTQLDGDTLLALLEEAAAARLVDEIEGQRGIFGRYAFSHALIRETLYDELSTTRRVRLHKQIGETFESLYAASIEPHLSELAYHFGEAAAAGEAEKAVDYGRRAGDRAMELLGYEEAVRLYQAALQASELLAVPQEAVRCELLIALGRAYWGAGQGSEAQEVIQRAAAVAKKSGTPEQLARAAIAFGGRLYYGIVTDDVEVALLNDALEALDPDDSVLRATVMSRLGAVLWSYPEQRENTALAAVAMARRLADPAVLAYALAGQRLAVSLSWPPQERLALVSECGRLAEEAGDVELVGASRFLALLDLLELGEIERADAELEAASQHADQLRQPLVRYFVARTRPVRSIMEGRFAEAEALAVEALSAGQRLLPLTAPQTFGAQLFLIRRDQGRIGELEAVLGGMLEQNASDARSEELRLSLWRSAFALLLCDLGRDDEARQEFEQLGGDEFAGVPDGIFRSTVLTLLAETCAALGDAGRAVHLYDLLGAYANRNIIVGGEMLIACLGSGSRYLGLLATILGRYDDAQRHFEEALAMNMRMGARPLTAHTQHDYASMLLRRGVAGGSDRASVLLQQSLATARELDMRALVRVIERLSH